MSAEQLSFSLVDLVCVTVVFLNQTYQRLLVSQTKKVVAEVFISLESFFPTKYELFFTFLSNPLKPRRIWLQGCHKILVLIMFYFLFLVLFIGFGLLAQDIPEQKILVLYNEQPQQESNTGLERQRYQETMKLEVAVITRCWLKKKKKKQ